MHNIRSLVVSVGCAFGACPPKSGFLLVGMGVGCPSAPPAEVFFFFGQILVSHGALLQETF